MSLIEPAMFVTIFAYLATPFFAYLLGIHAGLTVVYACVLVGGPILLLVSAAAVFVLVMATIAAMLLAAQKLGLIRTKSVE